MPREEGIHQRIMRDIRAAYPGCKVVKHHANQYTGPNHPDLYGCINGRSFVIEVKQPGEEPTPGQHAQLREWKRAGAVAGWATSPAEALDILMRCMDGGG